MKTVITDWLVARCMNENKYNLGKPSWGLSKVTLSARISDDLDIKIKVAINFKLAIYLYLFPSFCTLRARSMARPVYKAKSKTIHGQMWSALPRPLPRNCYGPSRWRYIFVCLMWWQPHIPRYHLWHCRSPNFASRSSTYTLLRIPSPTRRSTLLLIISRDYLRTITT